MEQFLLTGKKALITGASSGIGRQIAICFAEAGAQCVITGRDAAKLTETAEMMKIPPATVSGDLLKQPDREAIINATGKIDVFVNSAGAALVAPVRFASEQQFRDPMEINYMAPMLLLQQLLWKNCINKEGSIIFIASIGAQIGLPGNGVYSASKAALIGLSRCLALEVARSKIRVNCICPSYVDTPLIDAAGIRDALVEREKLHPLGIGRAEDVANTAVFLASSASRWLTGQAITLDGGYTII